MAGTTTPGTTTPGTTTPGTTTPGKTTPGTTTPGKTTPGTNGSHGGAFGLTTTAAISQDAGRVSAAPISIAPPRKKAIHPMVWAFIAMAAVFGGVAAWALFLRNPVVVYLPQGTAATAATNVAAPPPPPDATSTGEAVVSTAEPVQVASGGPTATWGTKGAPTGTTKPGETVAPLDTSKFGGPGPKTAEVSSTTTTGPSGGPLSEGQANGVVASNTPRVRRKCWDSISGSRSSDAPRSVRVNVSINVAPSGKVSSAGASGGNEKHYPGLVSCVQSTVSGWTFPTSGEGGKFAVPFNFSVQ